MGLILRDGARVALKIHRGIQPAFLEATQVVQQHLWRRGFPCPEPLGVRGAATLERWTDAGEYRDAHDPDVRRAMAETLAWLVRVTNELGSAPWLSRHFYPAGERPLWPRPHNVLFDFEATASGAEWIDEIAAAAKPLRDEPVGAVVIATPTGA